ncbi:MAG TPA: hypothetical protein VMK42_06285 [Anaeromyxobacteraceae bacterium]|nr:hypothetical protein [Anaeromyxobacteraceae bacterium]
MTRIPPPWMIEELERQRRAIEETRRPELEAPLPSPARGPAPREEESVSRVVVIDLWPSDDT